MSATIYAISGSGGGRLGPQHIYPILEAEWEAHSVTVVCVDTIQDDINKNIEYVVERVKKSKEKIYLMGYSMGGAVAAQAAYQLKDQVEGLILLASQTDGLHILKELNIPLFIYHGQGDQCFPSWQLESVYKNYEGRKRMVQIENVGHNFFEKEDIQAPKKYREDLAHDIMAEISDFFFENGEQKNISKKLRLRADCVLL